jgi:hypothetical protein
MIIKYLLSIALKSVSWLNWSIVFIFYPVFYFTIDNYLETFQFYYFVWHFYFFW